MVVVRSRVMVLLNRIRTPDGRDARLGRVGYGGVEEHGEEGFGGVTKINLLLPIDD